MDAGRRSPGSEIAQPTAPYVGQSVARLEDAALLTGRGVFADDMAVKAGTLHAAILRSAHAHARIRHVDVRGALGCRGVRAILTPDDVARAAQPFVAPVRHDPPMRHCALAQDRVRYVGEPIAVVMAESRYLAEDALEQIQVDYEPLDATLQADAALAADAPLLHPHLGSNVVSDRSFVYGDPDAAFAAAAHCVQLTVQTPRYTGAPMECGVIVADYTGDPDGGDSYDVLSNFMGPMSLHTVMALSLGVPPRALRLRYPRDSGGSFGVKQSLFPSIVLLCLAAKKARAPIKWVEDRREQLTAATSATARRTAIAAAVERDGRITALSFDQIDDVGAYLRAPEPATFYRMHGCMTGAYAVENLRVRNRAVVTNKTPAGLVRGFGGPQVYFALERLMQRIAVELALDPLDVYRRNLVPADAFPYRAAAGALLDSGNYAATMTQALSAADWPALLAWRDGARAQGRLCGIGLSAVVEPSISNMGYVTTALPAAQREKAGPKNGAIATASVGIDPHGGVLVVTESMPAGQGHRTVCAQVVADVLGLTPGDITVSVDLDTQKDAWSIAAGNYSSRFAGAVAGAVHMAAQRLRTRLAQLLAPQLETTADEVAFSGGRIFRRGAPTKSLPFARAVSGLHWAPGTLPEPCEPPLRETVFWTPPQLTAPDAQDRVNASAAYGFVFDICAIELDRATGGVQIVRYVTAHDAGRLLHPALADGQVRGGFAQAVGAALWEELRYGADGQFLSGTFADYLLPTAVSVPDPTIVHTQTPSPFTPLGAKGIGEGNSMSTPVCIANAVADALSTLPRGRDAVDIRLPLTPARVVDLIAACAADGDGVR